MTHEKYDHIWPNHPTLGHISRQNYNSKRYIHPYVHCSTSHNSQDMEAASMSINMWMDKEDALHVCSGILVSHKNNKIVAFAASWIQLEIIILSDERKRKINTTWYNLYVESKILQNEHFHKTETNSQRTGLWLPRGSGWGGAGVGVWN